MNWDDLRTFLAVATSGGLSPAARRIGVNHATVQRRIGRLEESLGVLLFDRRPSGYVLTAAGEELAGGSGDLEERMLALEARVAGRDLRLSGTVRLTTVDSLADTLLPGYLHGFRKRYPEVTVEMIIENRLLNLTRREADIALRPSQDPGGTMVGRRVGRMGMAVYAAAGKDIRADDWIGGDDSLGHLPVMKWFIAQQAGRPPALRCNSFAGMAYGARAGLGATAPPCILADADPLLRRLGDCPADVSVDLWLLVHPDIRRVARVRALLDHVASRLKNDQSRLAGG